jgi:hypothetical protein
MERIEKCMWHSSATRDRVVINGDFFLKKNGNKFKKYIETSAFLNCIMNLEELVGLPSYIITVCVSNEIGH